MFLMLRNYAEHDSLRRLGDAFVDFDNDGWIELFMVNGHVYPQVDTGEAGARYREPGLLFLNQHNGKFKDISKLVGPAQVLESAAEWQSAYLF